MTRQPTLEGVPPKPRKPRVMRQPRKAWLRAKLEEAQQRVRELEAENQTLRRAHWWLGLFRRSR